MRQSEKRKRPPSMGYRLAQARETFWNNVGQEAVQRAGRGPQLKGIIHEIGYREVRNRSLSAILSDQRTSLTRSTNATTVDMITTRNGRILERLQSKDCISDSGVKEIHRRVSRGQYRTSRLVGTKETTQKFDKAGGSKKMKSSGISSRTTTRTADNVGANVRHRNLFLNNARDILGHASHAGLVETGFLVGCEASRGLHELCTGEVDSREYFKRTVVNGTKSGLATAAKTAIALAIKEAAKMIAKGFGMEGLKRFVASNAATVVAFAVVEQTGNTFQLARGKINGQEYGTRSMQTMSSTSGAVGGAIAGAAIGSALPIGGTMVGAAVGSFIGGTGCSHFGRKIGERVFTD